LQTIYESFKPIRNKREDGISIISLGLVLVFWASLFSSGIFELVGRIMGQIIILVCWVLSLTVFGKNAWRIALHNASAHSLELMLLVIFVIVNLTHLLLNNGDMAYTYFVRSILILVVFLTVVIHLRMNIADYKKTVIFIIIVFGIISAYVTPILFATPFIARLYEFTDGEIPWFGSWSFFMPLAITMPCFMSVTSKQKGILKPFLSICCLSIGIMIILSTFAASIILMLMGLMGLLLFSVKNKAKLVAIIGFIFLILILVVNFVDFSDDLPQVAKMVEKIQTIFTYKADLAGDDNDPRIRASFVQVSVNTFLKNPFFGAGLYGTTEGNIIGAHSGIIDGLAQYGVFGIMWYFGFIILGFRRLIIYLRAKADSLNRARLVTILLFLIGALGNPVLTETSFCTLVIILALSPIQTIYSKRVPSAVNRYTSNHEKSQPIV
jgi:hypothetical protein